VKNSHSYDFVAKIKNKLVNIEKNNSIHLNLFYKAKIAMEISVKIHL